MSDARTACVAVVSTLILLLEQPISAHSIRLITWVHLPSAADIYDDILDEGRGGRLAIDPVEASMSAIGVGAVLCKPK